MKAAPMKALHDSLERHYAKHERERDAAIGRGDWQSAGRHDYAAMILSPLVLGARSLDAPDGRGAREAFEVWITAPPYERDVSRWPTDADASAWPGQYRDLAVQLAFEAWTA